MLRALWAIISVLAVANLLAILGFAGWLTASGRLDPDRVERLRVMLAETTDEERDRLDDEVTQAVEQAELDKAAARVGTLPLPAEDRIRTGDRIEEVARQRYQRLERETNDLFASLRRERQELDQIREEFQAERDAWQAMREAVEARQSSEQFQKAVSLLGSVKADQAKAMLTSIITGGDVDQAVAYVNAMEPRAASKVLASFEKDDPNLAAELLERVRLLGTESVAETPIDEEGDA
ncbi:MAG: hypothetical protein AAGD00_06275 [Planctomycetota bacterium]